LFGTGALTIWHRCLALALCAMLLATFAFSGHAATQSAPALPIFADWLHLGATALWVGGLVQFVLVLPALRAAKPSERVAVLACMIERFSPLALGSVVALAATGVYAALLHLQAWSALWTTRYGQILLAKVILFGALVLLGAYNMIVVRPRFRAWATRTAEALLVQRWQRRFMRSVRSEVVLALLVIMAAGALTSLAPAPVQTNVASAARTIPSVPFDQTQHVDDLHVRLQVTPASISRNEFRVTVADTDGQPVEAQLVRLEIDMIDMDMGETRLELPPSGPGEYSATASPLSMVGEWRITVLVRRADADDVRAVFTVPVGQ
jgi:copper transport protein